MLVEHFGLLTRALYLLSEMVRSQHKQFSSVTSRDTVIVSLSQAAGRCLKLSIGGYNFCQALEFLAGCGL